MPSVRRRYKKGKDPKKFCDIDRTHKAKLMQLFAANFWFAANFYGEFKFSINFRQMVSTF